MNTLAIFKKIFLINCVWLLVGNEIRSAEPPPSPALKVLVSLRPLYWVAKDLIRGRGEAILLLEGSPHHVLLKPSQVEKIVTADKIVWVGPSFENGLAGVMEKSDRTKQFRLLESPDISTLPSPENPALPDGHLWLSPQRMIQIAKALTAFFIARDPQGAGVYKQNLRSVLRSLEKRDAHVREQLAPFRTCHFMVVHHALAYLVEDYGLLPPFVLQEKGHGHGVPSDWRRLSAFMSHNPHACCFLENATSPFNQSVAQKVTQAGGSIAFLDLLGQKIPLTESDYGAFIQDLIDTLTRCFKGTCRP